MKYFIVTLPLVLGGLQGCIAQPPPSVVRSEVTTTMPEKKTLLMSTMVVPPTARGVEQFPGYLVELKQKALAQGINQQIIDEAFSQIQLVQRVIRADQNQLEKKVTLDDYLRRVLPHSRITQGKKQLKRYQLPLAKLWEKYGVPAPYLVALWGMESSFGQFQGKEDVLSALASLAFYGRREDFFVEQLMAALKILQRGDIHRAQLKGSWAGAMGHSQFIPTSFLRYGVDGDGDNRVDIWTNLDDVFSSMANYLAQEGWQQGVSWGQEVQLPAEFDLQQAGIQQQRREVREWQALGVVGMPGKSLPPFDQQAWIVVPDNQPLRAFLVSDNFRVLMHWNRSYYFAISVGMMADGMVE